MLKKCPYCDQTHYESCDRIDCMEVVIERQAAEHKALARVHEDLKAQYNQEHAMLERMIADEKFLRGEGPDLKAPK